MKLSIIFLAISSLYLNSCKESKSDFQLKVESAVSEHIKSELDFPDSYTSISFSGFDSIIPFEKTEGYFELINKKNLLLEKLQACKSDLEKQEINAQLQGWENRYMVAKLDYPQGHYIIIHKYKKKNDRGIIAEHEKEFRLDDELKVFGEP